MGRLPHCRYSLPASANSSFSKSILRLGVLLSLAHLLSGFAIIHGRSQSRKLGIPLEMSLGNPGLGNKALPDNALIITIGPPACGKTTWIKRNRIHDIKLDDQPSVYIPIRLPHYLLAHRAARNQRLRPEEREIVQTLHRNRIHGKSLLERITAPRESELLAIIQRLRGNITANKLRSLLPFTDVHVRLCQVVEQYIRSRKGNPIRMSPNIQLFVAESLFQGGMLDRAVNQLQDFNQRSPVAWGNTNTRPFEYQRALEMAWKQQRPVFFCLFEPAVITINDTHDSGTEWRTLFDLRVKSFDELLLRSIERFVQTGIYIPAQTIYEMNERWIGTLQSLAQLHKERVAKDLEAAETIVPSHATTDEKQGEAFWLYIQKLTKFELHQQLAMLAGYEMNGERFVAPTKASQIDVQ